MNGQLKVVVTSDFENEEAELFLGTLVGFQPSGPIEGQLAENHQARELVARMVIDWAASFADLDVTVH